MPEERRNQLSNFSWQQMDEHIDKKLLPLHEKLDELTKLIKSGYPDGDLDGHRRAHEEWIEHQIERKKLWVSVRTKLAESAAWTIVVAIVGALWYWIKGNIK
jgi:hypothetical protein